MKHSSKNIKSMFLKRVDGQNLRILDHPWFWPQTASEKLQCFSFDECLTLFIFFLYFCLTLSVFSAKMCFWLRHSKKKYLKNIKSVRHSSKLRNRSSSEALCGQNQGWFKILRFWPSTLFRNIDFIFFEECFTLFIFFLYFFYIFLYFLYFW